MTQKFSTTVSGSVTKDSVTNKVIIEIDGIPEADLQALASWLTDWIPVVMPTPIVPPVQPVAPAGKR